MPTWAKYILTDDNGLESDRNGLQAPYNQNSGVYVKVELMLFEIPWIVSTNWHMAFWTTPTKHKSIEKTLT